MELKSLPDGVWEDRRLHSDEDLLRLCAQGQSAALEELVRRYQDPIYRLQLRCLGSPDDAEEAALEVFVRVWQHAPRFQFRSSVSTWLYRIATNLAYDTRSRRDSRSEVPWPEEHVLTPLAVGSAEEEVLDRLEHEARCRSLRRALAQLNKGDRMLLDLYYLEACDYKEIQAITGLSYEVLKTRLMRARRRLRALLDKEDGAVRS